MIKKWENMTREEIKEKAEEGIVIITIGATEQHGPHLPVMTDNIIVEAIAEKSIEKASEFIPIIQGPNIPFGYSHHHFLYEGVISLSVQTLLTVLKETVESVLKSGFKKIFIINSHGGNDEIIRLAAKDAAYQNSAQVGAASYWNLSKDSLEKYKNKEKIYDTGHAGQFETSLILAISPDLVRFERLKQTATKRKIENLPFESVVPITSENIWEQIDGYSDEPLKASKETGEMLLELITNEVSNKFIKFYSN